MDYGKWIVELFGERCTKESHHHDRDSEPEWCDKCFAYAQQDEIERLREALQFYAVKQNYAIPAPSEERGYRRATKIEADAGGIARSALQQKDSE